MKPKNYHTPVKVGMFLIAALIITPMVVWVVSGGSVVDYDNYGTRTVITTDGVFTPKTTTLRWSSRHYNNAPTRFHEGLTNVSKNGHSAPFRPMMLMIITQVVFCVISLVVIINVFRAIALVEEGNSLKKTLNDWTPMAMYKSVLGYFLINSVLFFAMSEIIALGNVNEWRWYVFVSTIIVIILLFMITLSSDNDSGKMTEEYNGYTGSLGVYKFFYDNHRNIYQRESQLETYRSNYNKNIKGYV